MSIFYFLILLNYLCMRTLIYKGGNDIVYYILINSYIIMDTFNAVCILLFNPLECYYKVYS